VQLLRRRLLAASGVGHRHIRGVVPDSGSGRWRPLRAGAAFASRCLRQGRAHVGRTPRVIRGRQLSLLGHAFITVIASSWQRGPRAERRPATSSCLVYQPMRAGQCRAPATPQPTHRQDRAPRGRGDTPGARRNGVVSARAQRPELRDRPTGRVCVHERKRRGLSRKFAHVSGRPVTLALPRKAGASSAPARPTASRPKRA